MQAWSLLVTKSSRNCKKTIFLLSIANKHQLERIKKPIGHIYTFWIFYDDVARSSQNVGEKWVPSPREIRVGKFQKVIATVERFSSAENMHNSTVLGLEDWTVVASRLKKVSKRAESKLFETFRPEIHWRQKPSDFFHNCLT